MHLCLDVCNNVLYWLQDIWVPQRAGRLQRITDIGFHFEDDRMNDRRFPRGAKQFRTGGRDWRDSERKVTSIGTSYGLLCLFVL